MVDTPTTMTVNFSAHLADQLGDRLPGVRALVLEGITAVSTYRPEGT